MRNTKTLNWTMAAMMAAMTSVLAQIVIPVGLVPITMGTMGVLLTGGLLGAKWGSVGILLYMLLGIAGVPVFQSFTAGVGVLLGPTGGYIIGYFFLAAISGFAVEKGKNRLGIAYAGMAAGTFVMYTFGTVWFMLSRKMGWIESLSICVLPFLPMDTVKVLVAGSIAVRVRKLVPSIAVKG